MPIFKRKGIKKTNIECENCKLHKVDKVQCQLTEITPDEIEYIIGKMDFPKTNNVKLDNLKKQAFIISLTRNNYLYYKCYVCGWFTLRKKRWYH